MSGPVKITCVFLAVLYITYHLISLSYHPLPSEEETFLASIALNFKNHATFVPTVNNNQTVWNENFSFEPIYFIAAGLSFKILGFGLFQFRIVTLLAGFVLIWIFAKILVRFNFSYPSLSIIATAFLLDPLFLQSMHEGKMILPGLAFIFSSAVLLLKTLEEEHTKKPALLFSGLLSLLAMFTTPVMTCLFLTLTLVFLIWLIRNFSKENFLNFTIWFIPVVLIYTLGIYMIVGGAEELFIFMKSLSNEKTGGFLGFFKPGFHIPNTEWVLIISAIFCLLYKLNSDEMKLSNFYLFSLLSIIVFYAIIIDPGTMTVLIIPFYYFIIADSMKGLSFKDIKNPFWYMAVILLLFNFTVFSIKELKLVQNQELSDYKQADSFINNNIPQGSKVVGDARYFYSVIKAGSDFQFISKHPEKDLFQNDYHYLIITDELRRRDPQLVAQYFMQAKFRKVASLRTAPAITGLKGMVTGYNADIYVRLKLDQTLPTALLNYEF